METTVIKQLESTRWEIMVKKADLLSMIKVVALYHIRKTPKEKLPIILHEVTDEDMPIIISYIENSLSGLLKLISNYLSKPFSDYNIDPNFLIFELSNSVCCACFDIVSLAEIEVFNVFADVVTCLNCLPNSLNLVITF